MGLAHAYAGGVHTLYEALRDLERTRKARFHHPVIGFKRLHPTGYPIRSAKSGMSSA
jgi:hypothetical protein